MRDKKLLFRVLYSAILALSFFVTVGISILLESKIQVFNLAGNREAETIATEPFPVSVNVAQKLIVEDPSVDEFYYQSLAQNVREENSLLSKVAAVFASKAWYQNLASPVSRIIVIWPGERHEQAVYNIAGVLRWNQDEREAFINHIQASEPVISEGKFLPGKYVVHRNARPDEVATMVEDEFNKTVLARYTDVVEEQVPFNDALIIASLIEREASDFENMREVSGVIWNRLFIEMPLQLDATLQYARGSKSTESSWWPAVRPADKYVDSPYNTYKNAGLPPAPIANPSLEAIVAALNPIQTSCLYYFHDDDKTYYCSDSYEEHVEKLRSLYGRGR